MTNQNFLPGLYCRYCKIVATIPDNHCTYLPSTRSFLCGHSTFFGEKRVDFVNRSCGGHKARGGGGAGLHAGLGMRPKAAADLDAGSLRGDILKLTDRGSTTVCKIIPAKLRELKLNFPKMADWQAVAKRSQLAATVRENLNRQE